MTGAAGTGDGWGGIVTVTGGESGIGDDGMIVGGLIGMVMVVGAGTAVITGIPGSLTWDRFVCTAADGGDVVPGTAQADRNAQIRMVVSARSRCMCIDRCCLFNMSYAVVYKPGVCPTERPVSPAAAWYFTFFFQQFWPSARIVEKKIFFHPAGGDICPQDGRPRNSC